MDNEKINRIARMVLSKGYEWVDKKTFPKPPRDWGNDYHETDLGWAKGKNGETGLSTSQKSFMSDSEREDFEKNPENAQTSYNMDVYQADGIEEQTARSLESLAYKKRNNITIPEYQERILEEKWPKYLKMGRDSEDKQLLGNILNQHWKQTSHPERIFINDISTPNLDLPNGEKIVYRYNGQIILGYEVPKQKQSNDIGVNVKLYTEMRYPHRTFTVSHTVNSRETITRERYARNKD